MKIEEVGSGLASTLARRFASLSATARSRPDMAMAGGTEATKLGEALKSLA
jgi:hypothetical protein